MGSSSYLFCQNCITILGSHRILSHSILAIVVLDFWTISCITKQNFIPIVSAAVQFIFIYVYIYTKCQLLACLAESKLHEE